MVNKGKIFESDFKKSVPDYVLTYRLPDSAQSFGGKNNNLRFSNKNPFDFLLWNPKNKTLFALELKTVGGKSISFERTKDEKPKKEIHYHQIQGLNEWNKYGGIVCGFIIEFRSIETTIFMNIEVFNSFIESIDKKSFNYDDIINSGIPYLIIPQQKKVTRYTYKLDDFLLKGGF